MCAESAASRKALFAAACGGMLLFGVVLALLGTLFGLPEMRERLQADFAGQGNLFLLLYFGILLASLVAGPAIDLLGARIVLVLASLLVGVALVGLAVAQGFLVAALAGLLLGMGGGALNTATTALVSDLYGDARGSMLSYLGIFFGIGALGVPLAASTLAAVFTVEQLLLGAAGLAAAFLASVAVLPFPTARETAGGSLLATFRVARYPGVLLFGLILFCQSGNEAAVGGWTSTYLGTRGASPELATRILAGYWAALMVGRGLSGYLLRSMSNSRLVRLSAVGALLGCLVLFSAPSIPLMAAAVAVIGLCFASVFPATLAMAGNRYPRFAGTVYGLLFSIAVLGGMTFPWAVGQIGQAVGVRAGMALPILGTAVIGVLVAVIARRDPQS